MENTPEGKCKIPKLIHYKLKLGQNGKEEYFVKEKSQNDVLINNFNKPGTSKYPKIYIVKSGTEIIYVGYTQDSITNRLRTGLSPGNSDKSDKGKIFRNTGYAGYKWRFLDEVEYFV